MIEISYIAIWCTYNWLSPYTCSTSIQDPLYVNLVALFMWVVKCINGMIFKFMLRFWNRCELMKFFNHPKVTATLKYKIVQTVINHLPFLIWWNLRMHVVEETAEDHKRKHRGRSTRCWRSAEAWERLRTRPREIWSPTLEIKTRDFAFLFVCLFVCLFFFKSNRRGNFFFRCTLLAIEGPVDQWLEDPY